jgi:hypothetical protein
MAAGRYWGYKETYVTEEKIEKIQKIFQVQCASILQGIDKGSRPWTRSVEVWADYLNGMDCTYLDSDEEMMSLVNEGSFEGKVCIVDPLSKNDFILIPRKFAEKILVLGGLP